ncbi:FtsL-like putative cell division protein [candidate division KSB1 bacterium]
MAENINREKKTNGKKFSVKAHSPGRALQSILDGTLLTKEKFIKYLPFILFLTFLAIILIANNYYSEKTIIEVGEIKKELKEYRFQHISTKSKLMFHSKQSEVAKRMELTGIKESRIPPYKIILKNDE